MDKLDYEWFAIRIANILHENKIYSTKYRYKILDKCITRLFNGMLKSALEVIVMETHYEFQREAFAQRSTT